jgi:hypothetical protein
MNITDNDARFAANIRARLTHLKPGTRMVMGIYEARFLSAFCGTPLYRGRNTTYVTLDPELISRWLDIAEKKIAEAVASKFERS